MIGEGERTLWRRSDGRLDIDFAQLTHSGRIPLTSHESRAMSTSCAKREEVADGHRESRIGSRNQANRQIQEGGIPGRSGGRRGRQIQAGRWKGAQEPLVRWYGHHRQGLQRMGLLKHRDRGGETSKGRGYQRNQITASHHTSRSRRQVPYESCLLPCPPGSLAALPAEVEQSEPPRLHDI